MTRIRTTLIACTAAGLVAMAGSTAVAQSSSPLTIRSADGRVAHFFPTHQLAKQFGLISPRGAPPPSGPLVYHGGPVMQPALHFQIIYWQPSTLQSGASTTIPTGYKTVETALVHNYLGRNISAINTQYYQTNSGTPPKSWITGTGSAGAPYTDTQPYPTSGCDASIGANCITDAQLQAEVQRVMGVKGWTGGLAKMYLVFTSSGEGSCFDTSVNYCSTETASVSPYFCAYHSHIGTTPDIIYSNEPFGNPNYCLGGGTQPNSAVGGPNADPAATAASHEISEAITDPQLNAWYASDGSENGDLCAYNYGTNTWDGSPALANQYWGGRFFELQTEFDNHTGTCVLSGP